MAARSGEKMAISCWRKLKQGAVLTWVDEDANSHGFMTLETVIAICKDVSMGWAKVAALLNRINILPENSLFYVSAHCMDWMRRNLRWLITIWVHIPERFLPPRGKLKNGSTVD
jgi:hypothetical protein